ncbi:hypothetical protein ANCCAN_27568 [Ancylostoma caninum]|uniref:Tc3 transposase DNA binding domain-containing protein n=1 Tax=Ancylostoma caninum TaxID=29170 RepID=A0A368F742_ANCCA|nr:hypothetical protein ANCCAN_27568 [Ancylostoma caninum]
MLAAEEQAVISALKDAGESHKKIAEKFKRSRHVVASYLSDPQAYGKKKSCGRPARLIARMRGGFAGQLNRDPPPDPCRCAASNLSFHRVENDPWKRSHPPCRTDKNALDYGATQAGQAQLCSGETDWSKIV